MNSFKKAVLLTVTTLLAVCSFAATPPQDSAGTQPVFKPNAKSLELNEQGAQALKDMNFNLAESAFRDALNLDPGNLAAAYNLSGVYLVLKKNDLSKSLLTEYLKRVPEDVGLNVRMGDTLFASRDAKGALKYYELSYNQAPDYPGLASKLGVVLSLNNRLGDAEKVLLSAAEANPKDAQLANNLSSIFLANGKVDKAIGAAKRGLQINPTADLYVSLGNAYESMKDLKNAQIAFEKALALGSDKPELKQKIEQLKALGE